MGLRRRVSPILAEQPLVARSTGTSRATLVRFFRADLGLAPMSYIRQRRLEEARALLSDAKPGRSLKEVSYLVGYSDPSAFARAYRKLR